MKTYYLVTSTADLERVSKERHHFTDGNDEIQNYMAKIHWQSQE